jgi:uncharacterized protein YcbX
MIGTLDSIWRHPVKGFTPERLSEARLAAGDHFPFDRLYAVEDGPSGFDPAAPAHVSKQKFTVLARIPAVAAITTAYDETTATLTAQVGSEPPIVADLGNEAGRAAFASWLGEVLGDAARGPLRVLPAPGRHRFMDHPQGFVSIINLNSVRDLAAKLGRPVDPRRFRANLYVEGWPAWAETISMAGSVRLGEAQARLFKPIVRCLATHVDPDTAQVDLEVTKALFDHYGHSSCGVYVAVTKGGRIARGDPVELLIDEAEAPSAPSPAR